MRYGFIGAGNITDAIVSGVLNGGRLEPGQIFVHDARADTQEAFVRRHNVRGCAGAAELAERTDALIVAVKPAAYPALLPELAEHARRRERVIVSLAAGTPISAVERLGCAGLPIARAMPNMNAAVCESITAVCANSHVSGRDKQSLLEFFRLCGRAVDIDEGLFAIFGAIGGSSPAFSACYIDALALAAVKAGMSRETAVETAAQAVLGTAKSLLNGQTPAGLAQRVCSPGGTTIEGVCALHETGFYRAVTAAVDAALQKDARMRTNGDC